MTPSLKTTGVDHSHLTRFFVLLVSKTLLYVGKVGYDSNGK